MFNCERYSKTLELDKVLLLLSNEATLTEAKAEALKITPSSVYEEVVENVKNTEAAFLLTARYAAPSFGRATSPSGALTRAAAGGFMNIKEFLALSETLRVIRGVKAWRDNCFESANSSLDNYFSLLYPNKYLEDKILFVIKNEEEINDNASPKLFEIRKKINSAVLNIKNRLDSIVRNAGRNKYLQDAIVTQRDGRYVVPVKAEFKGEVPGIVHDTSSSGATLFTEPLSVVEINNELRVLKSAEKEEIDRILYELSSEAANFADTIISSYKILVNLNLIFAKASLAYKMRAAVPKINSNGHIKLNNARHPLIDKNKVVPISLELGIEYNSLIITGPNTGGKTVTLKTVGLLTLMVMCGMMIPVSDNSEISVFKEVLVDIGDEQSIEQSLSTFSAHITNIIDILKVADDNSLVLLDELGGGTDPVEGAALAKAILLRLHRLGTKTVATTHYAELKTYALDTVGVENACCEFDIDTLSPTYRLLIGVPGRSNAFAIAASLGIDESIINEAGENISDDSLRFERVVESIERSRKELENEKAEVTALKQKLLVQNEKLKEKLNDIENNHRLAIDKAQAEAKRILDNTRNEANLLLNGLETAKKELNAKNAAELINKARVSAKQSINKIEKIADPVIDNNDDDYVLPRELVIGDNVFITDLSRDARIDEINTKNNRCLVSAGSLKLWIDIKKLRLLSEKSTVSSSAKKTRTISASNAKKGAIGHSAAMELDIRGMNCEEGIIEVDRYIDNAVLSGLGSVSIIHGKGTGVLRAAIHKHLKQHSNVTSYRLGTFGEGESGVTIVEIKK